MQENDVRYTPGYEDLDHVTPDAVLWLTDADGDLVLRATLRDGCVVDWRWLV